MWTVLWKDGEKDRWDRFETEEEVRELLDKLNVGISIRGK